MKTGLSLTELARRIQANEDLKADYVRSTAECEVVIEENEGGAKPTISLATPDGQFSIRPTAHDQIGARVGIPAKYYDRCLADAPDLLAANVNTWFRRKPENRLVRTLGGDARAFLSDRYQRIDNDEVAKTVLPILGRIPGVRVVSSEITERRLYIQAVTPRQREVGKGDVVQAGVVISNSEIGFGAVSVQPLIYRLVCLNGLISADGKFRANHVGRRVDEGELERIVYRDDTRAADDRAVLLKLRDHVEHAVDDVAFAQRVEKFSSLAQSREIASPGKAVGLLAKKVGLTDSEGENILNALAKGGDLSAWGLINAVTYQAHSPSVDYDRSIEWEALGGKLVDLPKSEWQEILEAA